MFVKSYLLAAMAALSQAVPNPSPEASALAALEARQATCTPNGAAIFYPQTNYGGGDNALVIYSFQGEKTFCQQFQPIVKGPFSFKSYYTADIALILYKTSNCDGDGGLVISQGAKNTQSPNIDAGGFLSFQAVYIKKQ